MQNKKEGERKEKGTEIPSIQFQSCFSWSTKNECNFSSTTDDDDDDVNVQSAKWTINNTYKYIIW